MQVKIAVDTNTFVAVALDEPEKPWLIEATDQAVLVGPSVLPYEVGNALSAMVKRERLKPEEAAEALRIVRSIPVELYEVDVGEALDIAMNCGIYAYGAYFLHLAVSLRCPLLTLDRGMKRVARELDIEIVDKP